MEHRIKVDCDRLAFTYLPPCRVSENLDGWMRQGLENPLRHLHFRHIQLGVDGGHYNVKALEYVVGQIKRPIRQNIESNPCKGHLAIEALADPRNLVPVLGERVDAEPSDNPR